MRWLSCLGLAVALVPEPARAQDAAAFQLLRDWEPVAGAARTEAVADTLLLESGTIQTPADYAHFVFRFEYRLPRADGGAILFVRSRFDGAGVRGYGVVLDGSPGRGQLSAEAQLLHEERVPPPSTVVPPAQWVACEVRAVGSRLTVTFDGVVVGQAYRLDAVDGRVAFRATGRGGVELRGMRVAAVPAPPPEPEAELDPFPTGLLSADAPGVKPPKAWHRPRPVYPSSAFEARIAGIVELEVVIGDDGVPTHFRVKSTPHPDLGEAAIECARKWRFKPATKDRVPIPVVATMNVEFKSKH